MQEEPLCPARHELDEPLGHFNGRNYDALDRPEDELTPREQWDETHPPRPVG